MTALFITVLVASLVGSMHCAGMCGAFVAFAIGAADPAVNIPRSFLLSLYQLGRLVTYAALGAAAGALGAGIDLGGQMVGVQRTAAVLSGVLMVGFGVVTLLKLSGIKVKGTAVPASLTKLLQWSHSRAMCYSPPVRALATGLLTTLLPCGWLYAFVITAAGTGHALTGAALMATFWLGTLPMLTIVGVGVRKLAAPLAAKLPAITASAIVTVGVYTIVARAGITLHSPPLRRSISPAELAAQVEGIDKQKLPCCTQPAAPGERGAQ